MQAFMALSWPPVVSRPCRTAPGGMQVSWNDKRVWYAVAAIVVVLVIVAYAAGWLGGGGAMPPPAAPQ